MDQLEFVEDSLQKIWIDVVYLSRPADHITSNFLKAVIHNFTWSILEYFVPYASQARKQEFFRAGEFSRNHGTSINISFTTHKRKAAQWKIWAFFLVETLKTKFKMRNLTQDGQNQGIFFPKLAQFFPIFEKEKGKSLPPPSSYVPASAVCI